MFIAWLKLIHQGGLRSRFGFMLCLFLSRRVRFFIRVYKCLCGIRERESEEWSERSPLHTGSDMEILGGGSRLKSLVLCQEWAGPGGDAVITF